MDLKVQKQIAAKVFKVSPKRVRFRANSLEQIKESITRQDIKDLIKEGAIYKLQEKGVSRVRANYLKKQKAKGLRKGLGSRKGKATARLSDKDKWMTKVRSLRKHLRALRERAKIQDNCYRNLYRKIKGGYFRNKAHMNLYITEHKLWRASKTE